MITLDVLHFPRPLVCAVRFSPHASPFSMPSRIWPLAEGGSIAPVDLAPQADRLLLFISSLEHEVLPAWMPRYALTTWMFNKRHTAMELMTETLRQKKERPRYLLDLDLSMHSSMHGLCDQSHALLLAAEPYVSSCAECTSFVCRLQGSSMRRPY